MPEPGDGGIGHSWFVLELTSEHVPTDDEVVDPGRAGGHQQIYGGGPWMEDVEFRVPGRASLEREVELRPARGHITALPLPVAEFRVPGSVRATREIVFTQPGNRTAATHWSRLLREDEELLLSL